LNGVAIADKKSAFIGCTNHMDTFSALAEPTRRSILEFLGTRKELSATQIYDYINKQTPVTPPAISQHLKILRESKLVDVEKRAQQRIYSLNPRGLMELNLWIRKMTQFWDQRFEALDSVLAIEKKKLRSVKRHGK
jgi:DNA-binding transcriptional ArsR family regulator